MGAAPERVSEQDASIRHYDSKGTYQGQAEAAIALPRSIIGWDLFCWIGHRRFARHWSVPQIRAELLDSRQIGLAGALREVRQSLERNLQRKKGDVLKANCGVWRGASIGD
jgi:hypothetical protein